MEVFPCLRKHASLAEIHLSCMCHLESLCSGCRGGHNEEFGEGE